MPLRLTRELRVVKPSDYQAIFKNGVISKGKYWQIIAQKTSTSPRLGLAISKKIHKLAVERNRYKRIAREVFRIHQKQLNNWEFVVLAKSTKSAKPQNNTVLAEDLLGLFQQISA
ncbi:MAG: ribonuclease P protein component [Candidatus Thioglobus sp.]|nr:ribonuclease P protein component [Candidatus Thioglobus sp.]